MPRRLINMTAAHVMGKQLTSSPLAQSLGMPDELVANPTNPPVMCKNQPLRVAETMAAALGTPATAVGQKRAPESAYAQGCFDSTIDAQETIIARRRADGDDRDQGSL